jgi:hypothetical protein
MYQLEKYQKHFFYCLILVFYGHLYTHMVGEIGQVTSKEKAQNSQQKTLLSGSVEILPLQLRGVSPRTLILSSLSHPLLGDFLCAAGAPAGTSAACDTDGADTCGLTLAFLAAAELAAKYVARDGVLNNWCTSLSSNLSII